MKTKTLKFSGYVIKGIADLTLWGGDNASIQMKPIYLDEKQFDINNPETLMEHLNDNGFGVQSINGALCEIYENYEGYTEFIDTVIVGKVSDRIMEGTF